MGRTNPTFRDLLRALEHRWDDYRRALRRRDQAHYDALFEHAANHADAAGYLNPSEPMYPILLSMLLEHEKQLAEQQTTIQRLQTAIDEESPPTEGDATAETVAGRGTDADA